LLRLSEVVKFNAETPNRWPNRWKSQAFSKRIEIVQGDRSGWLRTQSMSNASQQQNSLLTGK